MSNAVKSIVAIIIGFVAIVVLSVGTDLVARTSGIFPRTGALMSEKQYLLALAYRIGISIFGCYLAARLAPARPMRHALWLGVIGVLFSAMGVAASYARPEFGPHWYPIALVIVALPCAWLGGRLGESKSKSSRIPASS